jgi:hypothetical protein
MYLKNPDIKTPNGNTSIWRYMGIEKFLYLITSRKLFFTRLSKMTDKYEGSVPEEIFHKRLKEIAKEIEVDPFDRILNEGREIEKFRDYTFINCWTINRHESYALWKIYLKGSTCGIAIKSTVGKLKKALKSFSDKHDFYIGQVNYTNDFIKYPPNQYHLTITKKPYYKFESELRVFMNYDEEIEKRIPFFSDITGLEIDIDIHELIETIYISPFTGSWFHKSFKEIITKIDNRLTNNIISSRIKDE